MSKKQIYNQIVGFIIWYNSCLQHPFDEFLGPFDLASLDHGLEDEVVGGGVGREVELAHLVGEIEHLVRQGAGHEVGAEVVVEEVDVGAVGLAGGGVEGADPELEELLHVPPVLLRHPRGEGLLEVGGAAGGGEGGHAVAVGEGAGGDDGGEERGGRAGGGRVAPVLAIEGDAGGGVRGERGGGVGLGRGRGRRRGELGLLRQRAGGGDRGAEEEEGQRRRAPAVAAEEERRGGRRRSHCGGLGF